MPQYSMRTGPDAGNDETGRRIGADSRGPSMEPARGEPSGLCRLMPATAVELIEATGRTHESVYSELVHLEACGLAEVRCLWTHHTRLANEWHCAPDALCYASRDGFCEDA